MTKNELKADLRGNGSNIQQYLNNGLLFILYDKREQNIFNLSSYDKLKISNMESHINSDTCQDYSCKRKDNNPVLDFVLKQRDIELFFIMLDSTKSMSELAKDATPNYKEHYKSVFDSYINMARDYQFSKCINSIYIEDYLIYKLEYLHLIKMQIKDYLKYPKINITKHPYFLSLLKENIITETDLGIADTLIENLANVMKENMETMNTILSKYEGCINKTTNR